MKNRKLFFITALFALTSCLHLNTKEIDTGAFTIQVPQDWYFKPLKGIDSYFGSIGSPKVDLTFDYSDQGFASGLLFTERQYLQTLKFLFENCKECVPGYDDKNLNNDLIQNFTRSKFKSKPVRIVTIKKATAIQRKSYPNADYWMYIINGNKTDSTGIAIPKAVKDHNIAIDTIGKFTRKLIWPKVTGKGITAIYVEEIGSNFNFVLSGNNLSLKDQRDALQAFKTIKFKE